MGYNLKELKQKRDMYKGLSLIEKQNKKYYLAENYKIKANMLKLAIKLINEACN